MADCDPFRLTGEVDLANARTVRDDLLRAALASTGDLVVDCAQLVFIDSSGLAALIEVRNHLHDRDRGLLLRDAPPSLRRVIEVTGLTQILPIDH